MRTAALICGLILLAGLWFGPLPELARSSFAGHMALHMGIVAIAAPLLAFGVAGTALDPVCRAPQWFPAVPLSVVELVVVWAWHTPVLHHAARRELAGFVVEQGTFLASGLLVWLAAVGGGRTRQRDRAGAGIAALLLTSMHMTLLGALLALTPRALFEHGGHSMALAPLADQHLGGAIMLLVGGVAYLAGGLWLTRVLLRERLGNVETPA